MTPPSSAVILRDLYHEVGREWREGREGERERTNERANNHILIRISPSLPPCLPLSDQKQARSPRAAFAAAGPTENRMGHGTRSCGYVSHHQSHSPPSPPSSLPPFLTPQVKSKPVLRARLLLLQDRLRIGWGTARVAVGMSVTASIYDRCLATQEAAAEREKMEAGERAPRF